MMIRIMIKTIRERERANKQIKYKQIVFFLYVLSNRKYVHFLFDILTVCVCDHYQLNIQYRRIFLGQSLFMKILLFKLQILFLIQKFFPFIKAFNDKSMLMIDNHLL